MTKNREIAELVFKSIKELGYKPYDIQYGNGYFLFEMGDDSVIHFRLKGLGPLSKHWKFGMWIASETLEDSYREKEKGTPYEEHYNIVQLFAQYDTNIDKFKPSKGKIVYLKSKPEILLFTTAHMLQIEPRFTYATIGTFNTKTAEEKLYYYVADINLFTEEEKESEDWIVESAQNIDSCKKIINENLDTTKISQLIDEINKIQTNYYNNVINPDFKDKIFHLAINHQLLESVCALQRVLMYAGLPYEFPKEIKMEEK